MGLARETIQYIRNHCNCSLAGKTVLITGANSGIGFKTAEIMVYLGASVIMACRNKEKGEAARSQLLVEYPDADIRIALLDLADFASIDLFADQLEDVDVFINNAGVFHHPHQKTADGFEMVMGTNYIGVFYLSEKILPLLRQCDHDVVYINTISIIHKIAHVNFHHFYDDRGSYARSKLCLARYTWYLVRKYRDTNIHIYMIHPGMAVTPIAAHVFKRLYRIAAYIPINSAEKSALAPAWILSHQVKEGSVVGPNRLFGGWGYPEINRPCRRAMREVDELADFTKAQIAKIRE